MARDTRSEVANDQYKPLLEVNLGGGTNIFPIYGSMSWTVSETRKRDWDTVLRPAYIEITGDTRDNVNRDAAMAVVAGELQNSWAKLKGREDLIPVLEANQAKRIADAVSAVEKSGGAKVRRPERTGRAIKEKKMTESNTEVTGEAAVADGATPTKEKGKRSIPTRGSMGAAATAIQAGDHDLDSIEKKVNEQFPQIKNARRHIQYVAGLLGVTLTKAGKKVEPLPDQAAGEATVESQAAGETPAAEPVGA